MFETVLVANRGEIARRVIRTLRRLGIRSVAVYSDADAGAPHVREADVAVRIGPAAASASYLDIAAVVAAARESGADAVHPGYGFLSENAAFARACADAGIVFIGPGERALEIMGDKIRARDHVAAHGVPIVPGFSAAGLSDADIAQRADAAGFPLLVKPSAGGGGKGMQVVRSSAELPDALATARRVSAAAFGDDTLLLERLIERPRHIEVQVMADAHGNVIHLGERECTLQRRHQKVIEEAPSPVVDAATRARLGAAACAAAASVDYIGAGTVEFLVAGDRPDDFFFIEMNTRLQVEHPVTEMVTGLDLVELQLRAAAGEHLPLTQEDVVLTGHAIEARVYAESPARGFLPQTGTVLDWRPATRVVADVQVRADAAIETGSVVTADYDPMIAKVIAHGDERWAALAALDVALADTVLLGVESNIGFLRELLAQPDVVTGDLDTGLIDRMPPYAEPAVPAIASAAASTCVEARAIGSAELHPAHASPLWRSRSGWRADGRHVLALHSFETAGGEIVTSVPADRAVQGVAETFRGGWAAGRAYVDGVVVASASDGLLWVHADGVTTAVRPLTRRQAADLRLARRERGDAASDPDVRAPMPGAVVAVHVAEGDVVRTGDRIATIEAMKMEHPVTAPHDGVVALSVTPGAQVRLGELLARVEPDPAGSEPPQEDR